MTDIPEKVKNVAYYKYVTDPEYRRQYLDKMTVKVECECGRNISRCNMSHHKKSNLHHQLLAKKQGTDKEIEEDKIKTLSEECLRRKKEITELKRWWQGLKKENAELIKENAELIKETNLLKKQIVELKKKK